MEETNEEMTFFKHMTKMDSSDKSNIYNMLQYAILAIVPIVLVLKLVKSVFPADYDKKASLEILAEIVGQLLVMILSIWLINRLVTYVPTFSGVDYKQMDYTSFMLGFLMILMTMQTKLGDKINILVDRVVKLWNGDVNVKKESKVTVSQPLSVNVGMPQHTNANLPLMAGDRPPQEQTNVHSQMTQQQLPQQDTRSQNNVDFNNMYQQSVPMAANDGFGSPFSSF